MREFDNGGEVGHAVILGSYKKVDGYARAQGYAPPLPTNAAAIILDEDGNQWGTSSVDVLPRLLL